MRYTNLTDICAFSTKVATEAGVNAAIVHARLAFFITLNKKKNHNFRDGAYWTFITIQELHQELPFLTPKQIRSAIDKLRQQQAITIGDHYNGKYRTTWYTIPDDILQNTYPNIEKLMPSKADYSANRGNTKRPTGQYNNSKTHNSKTHNINNNYIYTPHKHFCSHEEYALWRPLLPDGDFQEKHYEYCTTLRSEYGQDNAIRYLRHARQNNPDADIPTVLDKASGALALDYRRGVIH